MNLVALSAGRRAERDSRGWVTPSTSAIHCSPTRAFLLVVVFLSVFVPVFVSVFVCEACLELNVCRKSIIDPTRPDLIRPRVKQLRNFRFSRNLFNQI